ncbi:hypothetical protein PVT67_16630 [Gallaecimonas kandeliae]|uniref:DUF7674 family protein n=1 Tax=Gallaecimonas kandeliae TaxID=3029055 RepID=UPI002647F4EE|nr:hypothetical protein [Gallaecimonas kandeliae]WKE65269.1 hypothetical protein PVT67_16630 [Gallaecimonas kandeliae]
MKSERLIKLTFEIIPTSSVEIDKINFVFHPDQPPELIILSALGRCVYENMDNIDDCELERIFDVVEFFMEGHDDVSNAVATGYVEGIINQCDSSEFNRAVRLMKPLTCEYAKEWKNLVLRK